MSWVLTLLTLLADVTNNPNAIHKPFAPEDALNMSMAKIANRMYARIEDMPFVARLIIYHTHYTRRCGGALIKPQWVMTAAHCISNNVDQLRMVEVCMGETYLPNGYKCLYNRLVVKIFIPDEDLDFSVVQLSEPMPRIPKRIEAYRLHYLDQDTLSDDCMVMGWGQMYTNHFSDNLLTTIVTLIPGCPEPYICVSSKSNSVCEGDLGGPLICEDNIVGIGSLTTNKQCASSSGYAVYISTSYNLDFIKGVTENTGGIQWQSKVVLLLELATFVFINDLH